MQKCFGTEPLYPANGGLVLGKIEIREYSPEKLDLDKMLTGDWFPKSNVLSLTEDLWIAKPSKKKQIQQEFPDFIDISGEI